MCSIIKSPHPKINLSLVIESDFVVHVFCSDVEINAIEDDKITKHVTDQNTLEILMENTKKMDTEQQQTKPQNRIFNIQIGNIISIVGARRIKHFNSIKFLYEQLNLMTQNWLDYSK